MLTFICKTVPHSKTIQNMNSMNSIFLLEEIKAFAKKQKKNILRIYKCQSKLSQVTNQFLKFISND